MNTLNKEITREFFESTDGFAELQRRWRELINDRDRRRELRCEHHLLYQMLRGKDWRRSATRITNTKKLENGAFYDWAPRQAFAAIRDASNITGLLMPFGGTVTEDAIRHLRSHLPECRWNENPLDKEAYID